MRNLLGIVTTLVLFAPTERASAQCTGGATVDTTLMDSGPFTWDVMTTGAISNGSIDAYDEGFVLNVGGVYFPSTPASPAELAGRQVVHGPAVMSGLNVTRKVYVPTTDRWARFVDLFANPTASPITVVVRLETNVGSDGGTVITGSFNGDTSFTIADHWLTTDDTDGAGDPSLSHNFWGTGGSVTPSAVGTNVFSCAATNGPFAQYSLTVPAGRTVALMAFGSQNMNRAASIANAGTLDALPPAALSGLTAAESAAIVNWVSLCDTMDRDGDGTSCTAGDCNDSDPMVRPGAAERCNGIDDDCDAMIDDGFTLATPCTVGVGRCSATGTFVCSPTGTGTVCSATAGMPMTEICNGLDDDCDGVLDDAEPGLAMPEACNRMDDDCDGVIDDGFMFGSPCMSGMGRCARAGTLSCTADGTGTMCSGIPGTPLVEMCNGLDDDCDGVADDAETGLCATSMTGMVCLSTVPGTGFCGCAMDSDCGGPTSGRVCNTTTMRCAAGCAVGAGRNGCPAMQFCTVNTAGMDGMCTSTCNFDEQCVATMPTMPQCLRPTGGPSPMNRCVACTDDTGCAAMAGRPICNMGACVECTMTRAMACMAGGPGPLCLPSGTCGCRTDTDCLGGMFCHATTHLCTARVDAGGPPPPTDGGVVSSDGGGGTTTPRRSSSGCGCAVPGTTTTPTPLVLAGLFVVGLVARRYARRRRNA